MGKKEKAPKEDPNKLTEVDRTFYEITINDLNQKLARLRSHLVVLDENNVTLQEKLKQVTEDSRDIAAHLERTVEKRTETITEMEERLVEVIKVRTREGNEAAEKIKDLEQKFKAMNDQLTSEIKLLNGKLNSLDEFRMQRDVLMAKFDDQEALAKEKEHQHQELIYSMEQQAIVEKDAMRQEMEVKLLQVSEDFNRSKEIRNASYTKRLIRENVALKKEVDTLVQSQIQMMKDVDQNEKKNKDFEEKFISMSNINTGLIQGSNNKIKIITRLTENYEKLRAKHVEVLKYRRLYENLAKQNVCERFTINDLNKKLKILSQSVETLKKEKKNLILQNDHHERVISRLRRVLHEIKVIIQIAIKAIEEEKTIDNTIGGLKGSAKDDTDLRQYQRKNLLDELLDILSNHLDDSYMESLSTQASSVYKSGKIGFLSRSSSCLMEIFKRDAQRVVCSEAVEQTFIIEKEIDSQILPKSRAQEAGEVIDVQMGAALYISDSRDDFDFGEDDLQDNQQQQGNEAEVKERESGGEPAVVTQQSVSVDSKHEEETTAAEKEKEATAASSTADASIARGSRVSRMSRQPSLPDSDDEAYSINLFY